MPTELLEAPTKKATKKTKPPVNVDLMLYVYAYIWTHQEDWAQDVWRRCKTAFCYAGHVANLSGVQWAVPFPGWKVMNKPWSQRTEKENRAVNNWDNYSERVKYPGDLVAGADLYIYDLLLENGKTIRGCSVGEVAEVLLGIHGRSHSLFASRNTLADIRTKIGRLCGLKVSEVKARAEKIAKQQGWPIPS